MFLVDSLRLLLTEEPLKELFAAQARPGRNVPQDGVKGTNLDRIVVRNRDVMLALGSDGRNADVTAALTGCDIPQSAESPDQIMARHISRQFHKAITSSRVK